jgi:hypothetical protein
MEGTVSGGGFQGIMGPTTEDLAGLGEMSGGLPGYVTRKGEVVEIVDGKAVDGKAVDGHDEMTAGEKRGVIVRAGKLQPYETVVVNGADVGGMEVGIDPETGRVVTE